MIALANRVSYFSFKLAGAMLGCLLIGAWLTGHLTVNPVPDHTVFKQKVKFWTQKAETMVETCLLDPCNFPSESRHWIDFAKANIAEERAKLDEMFEKGTSPDDLRKGRSYVRGTTNILMEMQDNPVWAEATDIREIYESADIGLKKNAQLGGVGNRISQFIEGILEDCKNREPLKECKNHENLLKELTCGLVILDSLPTTKCLAPIPDPNIWDRVKKFHGSFTHAIAECYALWEETHPGMGEEASKYVTWKMQNLHKTQNADCLSVFARQ